MKIFLFELSGFELVFAFGGFLNAADGRGLALCEIQIVSAIPHLLCLQNAPGKLDAAVEPSEKRFKAFIFSSCDFEHSLAPLSEDGERITWPLRRVKGRAVFS